MLTEAQKKATLARFAEHRTAWQRNRALRDAYAGWYARVRERLPAPDLGPRVELGSGPGFARDFIPDLRLTDIVKAPWHDEEVPGDRLPWPDASVGALVLFDVLHHLPSPRGFFEEATRVLVPGGRVVLCEPYLSLLSYPVYKLLHDEPVRLAVDPLADRLDADKDPFDSNQAIPTLLFATPWGRAQLARAFPALAIDDVRYLAGPSYPASGGFSRGPLVPHSLWRRWWAFEDRWPSALMRLAGFRLLATLERR